jgi:hypothetical protein
VTKGPAGIEVPKTGPGVATAGAMIKFVLAVTE